VPNPIMWVARKYATNTGNASGDNGVAGPGVLPSDLGESVITERARACQHHWLVSPTLRLP
jgi:hypothetical protein